MHGTQFCRQAGGCQTCGSGRDCVDYSCMNEIVFQVTQEGDGGFVAECLSEDIFTQGNTWDELRANIREAVAGYFFDTPKPASVRLHLVRDEVLASA